MSCSQTGVSVADPKVWVGFVPTRIADGEHLRSLATGRPARPVRSVRPRAAFLADGERRYSPALLAERVSRNAVAFLADRLCDDAVLAPFGLGQPGSLAPLGLGWPSIDVTYAVAPASTAAAQPKKARRFVRPG